MTDTYSSSGKTDTPPPTSVQVKNFKPDLSDDVLEALFENKEKTGGGPVVKVTRIQENAAVITFQEPEDACRVVHKGTMDHKGFKVEMQWVEKSTLIVSPLKSKKDTTTENIPPSVHQNTLESYLKNHSRVHRKGNPDMRKLVMAESVIDKSNQLRSFVFGKKTFEAKEKVILVVGATGAGKSTLINGMINYIFGVEYNDPHRFVIITEDETSGDQAVSQTKHITAYKMHHQKGFKVGYTLTIIDTPGFGDTQGIERDQLITKQIRQLFTVQKGISHIDSICFVTQSSLPRLTHTQKYVFDQILALFGKDIENNIHMMLTFCDAQKPQTLGAIEAAKIPYKRYFKFNNSGIFAEKIESTEHGKNPGFDAMFWQMGMQSLTEYMSMLSEMTSISLTMTKSVLEERDNIQNNIAQVQSQITIGLGHLDRLQKLIFQIEQNMALAKANKKFTITETVPHREMQKVPIGQYVTVCNHCHWTCHNPCGIPNDADKAGCWAMLLGKCRICPSKCHWSMHQNDGYIYVNTTREEIITLNDLKQRYEGAKKQSMKSTTLVSKMTDEFIALQITVVSLTNNVRSSIELLQEIALKPNPMSTTEYIDILIKSEENNPSPGHQERANQLRKVRKDVEWMENLDKDLDPFAEFKKKIEQQSKSENVVAALEEFGRKENVTVYTKITGFFAGVYKSIKS